MGSIVIVLNPMAGKGKAGQSRARLERLLAEVQASQSTPTQWRIVETQATGQGSDLARQAANEGADIVAAAGGDGTLNEVLNGIIGTKAALGLLPLGTGNDFARCVGIGTTLRFAVETLLCGRMRAVDAGQANGRWFLNIAGCGFDALVAQRVNRGFPLLRGHAAYAAAIFTEIARLKASKLTLTLDGDTQSLQALMCSVANATSYGGGIRVAPDAQVDDGLFDLCVIGDAGRLEFIRAFPRVLKGTHVTHPRVTMLRARHIQLAGDPPLPLLIDGEVIGTTPITFTMQPAAVQVIVPNQADRSAT